jgi:proteic killer suppression protein
VTPSRRRHDPVANSVPNTQPIKPDSQICLELIYRQKLASDIWNGVNSKAARRIPRELWPNVRRKLDQIDAVTSLEDLKVPPGNRLHALGGNMRGLHAVRVNDQYRIVFRFEGADAFDVRCTDYH